MAVGGSCGSGGTYGSPRRARAGPGWRRSGIFVALVGLGLYRCRGHGQPAARCSSPGPRCSARWASSSCGRQRPRPSAYGFWLCGFVFLVMAAAPLALVIAGDRAALWSDAAGRRSGRARAWRSSDDASARIAPHRDGSGRPLGPHDARDGDGDRRRRRSRREPLPPVPAPPRGGPVRRRVRRRQAEGAGRGLMVDDGRSDGATRRGSGWCSSGSRPSAWSWAWSSASSPTTPGPSPTTRLGRPRPRWSPRRPPSPPGHPGLTTSAFGYWIRVSGTDGWSQNEVLRRRRRAGRGRVSRAAPDEVDRRGDDRDPVGVGVQAQADRGDAAEVGDGERERHGADAGDERAPPGPRPAGARPARPVRPRPGRRSAL